MLVELSIQRIALIESLKLRLDKGLLVFTGETGAGKSILLDAIGLLLGNRASADFIRSGADSAMVEALFQCTGSTLEEVEKLLRDWGIESGEGSLVISRELHRSGRTVCRINGRIATVQMLRELGQYLVQQHGQHDQHGLLRPEEQLRLLDLYAHHEELREAVREIYTRWNDVRQKFQQAQMDEQERVRRLDMLNFQIDEIESAKLKVGEEEELKELRARLIHADRIRQSLQTAMMALEGGNRQAGVLELLATASQEVAAAQKFDQDLSEVADFIETAQVHVDEAVRTLSKQLSTIDLDPAQLEWIENRLAQIRGLERKYGATVEDVLAYLDRAKIERDALLRHEEQLAELESDLRILEGELLAASMKLHDSRVSKAEQLSKEVQTVLRELSMPSAMLEISVTRRDEESGRVPFSPLGIDTVTYLFSANKGEELKPLQKIASGGELSRTLLAFKSVLAEVDDMETLIFDEIDAGVSGTAAHRIAMRLRELGTHRQVLCVTHAPQIAAAAHEHFHIVKHERETDTTTHVSRLEKTGRIHEIARLVGSDLSDTTALHHAEALLLSFQTVE
jgi:DNA repair protein RecN (Recombination protein N)